MDYEDNSYTNHYWSTDPKDSREKLEELEI